MSKVAPARPRRSARPRPRERDDGAEKPPCHYAALLVGIHTICRHLPLRRPIRHGIHSSAVNTRHTAGSAAPERDGVARRLPGRPGDCRALDESTLYAMQHDQDVVDQFAQQPLPREERLKLRRLGFSHRYTGVYEANLRANGGAFGPAGIRRRRTRPACTNSSRTRGCTSWCAACCRGSRRTRPRLLYPVYMARGNARSHLQVGDDGRLASGCDVHVLLASALNTTIAHRRARVRS